VKGRLFPDLDLDLGRNLRLLPDAAFNVRQDVP
jgi:hypothetical protein